MNKEAVEKLEREIAEMEADLKQPVPEQEEVPVAASEEAPVLQAEPATEEPSEDLVAKYKEEAEKWMKRRKDAEKGMNEAFQERAQLRKELEAKEAQLADLLKLKEDYERSKSVEVDPELWDGYEDIGKSVEKRLAKLQSEMDAKIRAAQAVAEEQRKRDEEMAKNRAAEEHYARVASTHKDADTFFNPEHEHHKAILGWALSQEPEYLEALENPLSKSPQFVTRVLREFKTATGIEKRAATPGLGDIAVKKANSPTAPANKTDADIFTDQELQNYERLYRLADREQRALMEAKLDRTYKALYRR